MREKEKKKQENVHKQTEENRETQGNNVQKQTHTQKK
jgi:hypothetical protein